MKITRIAALRHRTTKVCLDDGAEITFFTDVADDAGLYVGMDLSEDKIAELRILSDRRRAYENALYILEYRAHSEYELKTKLRQKGYSPDSIENSLNELRRLRLINDEDFARRYCEELITRKGCSERMVFDELHKKGIERDLAQSIVSEFEFDPVTSVKDIIAKKFTPLPTDEKDKRRMYSYILRRGFSFENIRSALSEFEDSEDFEEL